MTANEKRLVEACRLALKRGDAMMLLSPADRTKIRDVVADVTGEPRCAIGFRVHACPTVERCEARALTSALIGVLPVVVAPICLVSQPPPPVKGPVGGSY